MRWFLKILVALGGIAALGVGGLAWLQRDQAATHPSLVGADLPAMIPVRDFWADTAAEWGYKASADGAYIAHRSVRMTQDVLVLKATDGDELGNWPDVWGYFWSDFAPLLYVISEESRMWEVDPSNPTRENWRDVTPRGFANWYVNHRVPNADASWVVSSADRNPAYQDIYTTRQDGGGKSLFLENEGQTLAWILDHQQIPIIRMDRDGSDDTEVFVADGDDWRSLFTVDAFEQFWIYATTSDNRYAFASSSRGRDKAAIVRVDLETGEEEILVSDPDVDLTWALDLNPWDDTLDLVISHAAGAPRTPLSAKGQALDRLIGQLGEKVDHDGIFSAGDGRFVTVTASPEAKSYSYVLFDLETKTTKKLGEFSFRKRHLAKLAETQEVVVRARDGLPLPSLLMLPPGTAGPVPMIVQVHGGPASHMQWEYHHFHQFLVNRGYGVLAVNFRGSTGYGRKFQAAGFGEFGRAMQTDIYDAANWAVEQGFADPDAMAVLGGSYGGYASAMAATDPESPFSAAIIERAVLDFPYQMKNNPFAWRLNEVYMERYFGSADDAEDLVTMAQYSPITRAQNLSMPVLLIAGKRDRIVGFEQTEEFLDKLPEGKFEIDSLIFEDEGHGVDRWQNKIRRARQIEDFLAGQLGGRSGGWDYIEIAAEYLD